MLRKNCEMVLTRGFGHLLQSLGSRFFDGSRSCSSRRGP
jgi:hypothetical protein